MNKSIVPKRAALIPTVALMLSLFAGAAFAQQNLMTNGSFEIDGRTGTDNFTDWDWFGPADNNSDCGVAQSTVYPDVAEQGDFYAYFHGHPTDDSQDCLGQTVNLTIGAQYTISYYLATDGPTFGTNAGMWVVIGTSFGIDLTQDAELTAFLPNSSNAIPYQLFTTNYTATKSDVILSFHGVDSTSSILLDNVSVKLTVPQVNLSLSPTNTLVFTWTSQNSGFQLQANGSLSTTNWVTLTNAPVTAGSSNQIVLPPPASNVFYRLALP
jgi:hypothetical protein